VGLCDPLVSPPGGGAVALLLLPPPLQPARSKKTAKYVSEV
jgi:hypothetical protein